MPRRRPQLKCCENFTPSPSARGDFSTCAQRSFAASLHTFDSPARCVITIPGISSCQSTHVSETRLFHHTFALYPLLDASGDLRRFYSVITANRPGGRRCPPCNMDPNASAVHMAQYPLSRQVHSSTPKTPRAHFTISRLCPVTPQ